MLITFVEAFEERLGCEQGLLDEPELMDDMVYYLGTVLKMVIEAATVLRWQWRGWLTWTQNTLDVALMMCILMVLQCNQWLKIQTFTFV